MTQPSLYSVTLTVGGLETETDILVPSLSLGSNLLAACKQPMPASYRSNGHKRGPPGKHVEFE